MNNDIEYEGKILDIDINSIRKKLTEIGATKGSDQYFRRYVFDTIPVTQGRWVRLRTDNQHTTLTVKQINSDEVDGTNEWEVDVSDFEKTLTILEKIGVSPRGYQENKRENYILPSGVVSIDYWPLLDPYIEIESKNKKSLEELSNLLGYKLSDLVGDNTEKLYKDIGIDLQTITNLKF